jgi:transposase InsO family protein
MYAEKANFTVTMMARLLEVSRSGYYSWVRQRDCAVLDEKDVSTAGRVQFYWKKSKKRHGARRIKEDLKDEGIDVSLHKVRRLMGALGIQGIQPRTSKRTTVQAKDAASRPDLIKRDFASPVPTIKLVGDITYLKTGEGWLYLATVIDLCTRAVVGWAMADNMRTALVISALKLACGQGYVAKGAIFHSDKGSQYTSREYAEFASAHDIRLSVGRTGSCHDNAVAESFFSMLKNEMYYRQDFKARAEARCAVMEYIEIDYNRQRRHSTLGYKTPMQRMGEAFCPFVLLSTRKNCHDQGAKPRPRGLCAQGVKR